MPNPEDDVIISLRTSFTKDEAVAKMLGWMQGPIVKREINITEHGIPEDQLPELSSLHGSLQNTLNEVLQAARAELFDAAEEGAADEVLKEKEEAVERCKEYSHRAHEYLLDIDDELSKGHESLIRIDPFETERTGIPHLTLKSLDRWTTSQYNISVIDTLPQDKLFQEVTGDPASDIEEDSKTDSGFSRRKIENLLTTFAFLVKAFAGTAQKYRHEKDGSPNVSAISKHLEKLAAEANNGEKLQDHGHEAIKGRIEEASAMMRSKLPSNPPGK